jgi:hypothetical protein
VAPEAEDGIALSAHECVTSAVIDAVGVLRAVDFDDEFLLTAAEISEVPADRILTGEMITA